MNSDSLILRQTDNAPLTNKADLLSGADFDGNLIKIYNDLVSLASTLGVDAYDSGTTYDDTVNPYATNDGRLYKWINVSSGSAQAPPNALYWSEVFPTIMAHKKNSDTILAEGTADEVSASAIKAFIAAGETTTTDLGITTHTSDSFLLTSSTGADVTIPAATADLAGLMTATEKSKVAALSGTNTGDQSLVSLGAEATANKKTSLATPNDVGFPTTQAVATGLATAKSDIIRGATTDYDTLEKIQVAIETLIDRVTALEAFHP